VTDFPEQDWRVLRAVHDAALERYCTRVLDDVEKIVHGDGTAHERYLRMFRAVDDHNERIADTFNDMRRSRAMQRLLAMMSLGVVTDEELARFSAPTRETATGLIESFRQ
jgi:hypothetical protein